VRPGRPDLELVAPREGDERGHNIRIELQPRVLFEEREGTLRRPGTLVRALGDERVVHVDDGHDPRRKGDAVEGKAVGVAAPIPAFVVRPGDPGGHPKHGLVARAPTDRLAGSRVALHRDSLAGRERAWLVEDRDRNLKLAEVVERSGIANDGNEPRVKSHPLGHGPGGPTDVAGVLGRTTVDGFGERCESAHGVRPNGARRRRRARRGRVLAELVAQRGMVAPRALQACGASHGGHGDGCIARLFSCQQFPVPQVHTAMVSQPSAPFTGQLVPLVGWFDDRSAQAERPRVSDRDSGLGPLQIAG
jgi:hypothetical protein